MSDELKYHVDGSMACPLCGGEYTHVDDVVMSGRGQEDGPVTTTRVGSDGLMKGQTVSPSGSGRRHTITLLGSCEMCGGGFLITFEQHKGQTFIGIARTEASET
jgi:hypothetical protein